MNLEHSLDIIKAAKREGVGTQIIHGDCIEVMKTLPSDMVRLVIADPPYFNVQIGEDWDNLWDNGDEYLLWSKSWLSEAMRLLVDGGLLYCFGQVGKRESVFLRLMAEMKMSYQFHDLIIWDRVVGYNDRGDSWTPAYEMAIILKKGSSDPYFNKDIIREPYNEETISKYLNDKRYKDKSKREEHLRKGKYATNLWRIPSLKGSSKEKVGHPTQKPELLIERIVLSSSKEGEIVLDPFLGSGTTSVICKNNGRESIGIEMDADYVRMSEQRIK